ncbi:hypothetical protein SRAA_2347 [Serpentinimonas raichei]|jgi:hypothetical protein|uniref:Argininosuccinate lyase n=1 Tax=Serpentinimonas raichei TaxID=1458425 RepID=A0A060NJ20_9BURK|nr:hypothetical protein [Serpentinimonas raichei]BAO82201.1 hypothetical protein SRAA_2347 [Serpentinimonas raichei]
MKAHLKLFLLALAALWLAGPALAQSYYVDITNRTGFVITHIYVSPANSSSWEEDVLGNKVLAKGATHRVTLTGYRSPIFDIKLVDEDGDSYTYWKVDVSKRDIVARPEHLD